MLAKKRLTRREFIKLGAVAAGAVAAAPLVSACGSPSTQAPTAVPPTAIPTVVPPTAMPTAIPPKDLTVWVWADYMPELNPYQHKAFSEIGSKVGANVTVEDLPQSDETTARWAAAIEAKQLPDMAKIDSSKLADYRSKGLLADVSDIYAEIGKAGGGWVPAAEGFVTSKGVQYGICCAGDPEYLYYRKDKFKDGGYDVPVKSLDELVAAARKINDPSNNFHGLGFSMDVGDSPDTIWAVLWAHGGSWQTKDDQIIINTKENAAAVKWYTDLYKEGLVPKDTVSWDYPDNNTAYLAGQIACTFNAGSILASLRTDKKDVLDQTVIGPMPPRDPTTGAAGSPLWGWEWVIFSTCKDIDLAKKVLLGMNTGTYYEDFIKSAAGVYWPVLNNYLTMDMFVSDPWAKMIVEQVMPVTHAINWPGSNNPAMGELLYNTAIQGQVFQRILVDGWTVEKALDELQTAADAIVEKHKALGE
jgi:multiple sugar transport system substrate-binding protein